MRPLYTYLIAALGLISLIFAISTARQISNIDKHLESLALQDAKSQIKVGIKKVDELMGNICSSVDQIAQSARKDFNNEEKLISSLNTEIEKQSDYQQGQCDESLSQAAVLEDKQHFYQIGFAFEPNTHPTHTKLFAPGLSKSPDKLCFTHNIDKATRHKQNKHCPSNANQTKTVFSNECKLSIPLAPSRNFEALRGQYTISKAFSRNYSKQEQCSATQQLIQQIVEATATTNLNHLDASAKSFLLEIVKQTDSAIEWSYIALEKSDTNSSISPGLYLAPHGLCYSNNTDPKVEGYYNYLKRGPDTRWYYDPLEKGAGWRKPYFGKTAQAWLAEYSVPIQPACQGKDCVNAPPIGVAYANMSLESIRASLFELDLGVRGYAAMTINKISADQSRAKENNIKDKNEDAIIVSHPVKKQINRPVAFSNDALLRTIVDDPIYSSPNTISNIDPQKFKDPQNKNRSVWVSVTAIKSKACEVAAENNKVNPQHQLNPKLVVVIDTADFTLDNWEARRDWIKLLISTLIALCVIAFFALRVHTVCGADITKRKISLSWFAATLSVLCLLSLVGLWAILLEYGTKASVSDKAEQNSLAQRFKSGLSHDFVKTFSHESTLGLLSAYGKHLDKDEDHKPKKIQRFDKQSQNQRAEEYLSIFEKHRFQVPDEATFLKTRVFIQSLDFDSANNVSLTGYIWTSFPSDVDAKIAERLTPVFPEAESVSFESPQVEITHNNETLVRWYFSTTLRQQFSYRKYPFDIEDVWLRIWSHDLNLNYVLVPDFEAYTSIKPNNNPGVEENLVLEGWDLIGSFFSYRKSEYNTAFSTLHQPNSELPELYFNLRLKRNFFDPFIADMLPIFVVCLLVFAVLLISTTKESQIDLRGFSSANVLSYCAALYFVLIVSHVHLRESLNAHGIIYLEIFYFCMYFTILAVSANSLLITYSKAFWFIRFDDNYLVRLSYFPVITSFLLVSTVWMFY